MSRILFFASVVVLSAACAGPAGPQGEPGPQGPTGTTGPQGPAGTNGANGTNGTVGPSSLAQVRIEPPGTNCPAGGVAITVGTDTNRDGTLQQSEVSATSYVCESAATLSRVDVVQPGATCALGGITISTGRDLNENGLLEMGEVTSTQTLCGVDLAGFDVTGDVTISNSAEYGRFRNVRSISGTLSLGTRLDRTAYDFPNLVRVGVLTLSNTPATALSFPRLTTLTGGPLGNQTSTISNNAYLARLELPALAFIGVSLAVNTNGFSAGQPFSFAAPPLRWMAGQLSVQNNPYLVDCPVRQVRAGLATSGSLSVDVNVVGNGSQLASLDAGIDAGCERTCWEAAPSTTFRLDRDGGALPPGWFLDGGVQSRTYVFCDAVETWDTAQAVCASLDAGMVTLEDPYLAEMAGTRAQQYLGGGSFWGGAQDRRADGGLTNPDGGWQWVTGQNIGFTSWAGGEPNGGDIENCLQVYNVTAWNDLTCSSQLSVACQRP